MTADISNAQMTGHYQYAATHAVLVMSEIRDMLE